MVDFMNMNERARFYDNFLFLRSNKPKGYKRYRKMAQVHLGLNFCCCITWYTAVGYVQEVLTHFI